MTPIQEARAAAGRRYQQAAAELRAAAIELAAFDRLVPGARGFGRLPDLASMRAHGEFAALVPDYDASITHAADKLRTQHNG
jgi:hypothetical protein